MEHRWGERVGIDLPVRVTVNPFNVRHARLSNLSVSGGFVKADYELRPLSCIQVVIELPHTTRCEAPTLAAYVTRISRAGFGIEWCEFAPPVVSDLLASIAARPYMRLRRPESASAIAIARLSGPLLKHGAKAEA